jgi:hypothetical protein
LTYTRALLAGGRRKSLSRSMTLAGEFWFIKWMRRS